MNHDSEAWRQEKTVRIRRVVTGNDEEGKSYVKWDGDVEKTPGSKRFSNFPLWATRELPVELTEDDPNEWETGVSLGGGSVFRVCRWEPYEAKQWHRTDTIDYAYVISGEIYMQLDREEVRLKAGDVLIQRATNHNWVNRGPEPCVVLFVLISLKGGRSTGWDLKYVE